MFSKGDLVRVTRIITSERESSTVLSRIGRIGEIVHISRVEPFYKVVFSNNLLDFTMHFTTELELEFAL